MKARYLILAPLVILAACNSTPKNDVAAAEAALTAAEAAAFQYTTLPPCGTPNAKLCKDTATLAKIGQADAAAYGAVKLAESVAANASSSSSDVDKALAAAQSAVTAFQQILMSLPH